MSPLLQIENLSVQFETEEGTVRAVEGVSLDVAAAKTLCVVGESGCGKSVTCHSVLGLLPPNGRVTAGTASFDGRDLLSLPPKQLDAVRGSE